LVLLLRRLSNQCEFFQLRPAGAPESGDKQILSSLKFKQKDIAPASASCVAERVAGVHYLWQLTPAEPVISGLLFELMNAVEPALKGKPRGM
jgi:hypothetical protein